MDMDLSQGNSKLLPKAQGFMIEAFRQTDLVS
jgi:hypothetical protein